MLFNSLPLSDKPPFREICFEVLRSPVSLQSKSLRKNSFKNEILERIKSSGFLLSGDIEIEIKWHIHRKKRYEESSSADVDNIIKPVLDALSGKKGIMVDDTQVQCITCFWVDSYVYEEEKIEISIKYFSEEFLPKQDLIFVDYGDNLCFPLWENYPNENQLLVVKHYIEMLNYRKDACDRGMNYYSSQGLMPIQRIFNRHRLKDFKVIPLQQKLNELEK